MGERDLRNAPHAALRVGLAALDALQSSPDAPQDSRDALRCVTDALPFAQDEPVSDRRFSHLPI